MVQPHVTRAEEAGSSLAGGRSLLDAALTLQQDRIRDRRTKRSRNRWALPENLGSVEQISGIFASITCAT